MFIVSKQIVYFNRNSGISGIAEMKKEFKELLKANFPERGYEEHIPTFR